MSGTSEQAVAPYRCQPRGRGWQRPVNGGVGDNKSLSKSLSLSLSLSKSLSLSESKRMALGHERLDVYRPDNGGQWGQRNSGKVRESEEAYTAGEEAVDPDPDSDSDLDETKPQQGGGGAAMRGQWGQRNSGISGGSRSRSR